MDLEDKWEEALKRTEIVRFRVEHLSTFQTTEIPYIFLSESTVNLGDTVVREGRVSIHKPAIILPEDMPQFDGFELEKDYNLNSDMLRMFLMVRGISFPSLKYEHEVSRLDIFEGPLSKAKSYHKDALERTEDAQTGLIIGREDCWQFSLFIYVGLLISKSLPSDLRRIWEKFRDKLS